MTYQTPGVEGKRVNGLGIASMFCGVLGLLFSIIPMCGLIPAIALAVVGGILGLVGFFAAMSDRRTGTGFPIAGMLLCGTAIAVSIAMTMGAASAMKASMEAQQKAMQNAATQPTTRMNPAPLAP